MSSVYCAHCHQPMRFPCPQCGNATKALRGKWSNRLSIHYTLRECGQHHRSNWNGTRPLQPFRHKRAA